MNNSETHTAIARRFFDEVVNGGNSALIDELLTPGYVFHGGSLGDYIGLDAYKAFLAANGPGAFTGIHLAISRIIPQGDEVFVLFTNSGIHTGEFMGMPATGKHALWSGTVLFRFEGAQIAEATYVEDILHLFLQLGIKTLPGA
ncbi:ester cyclase [Variovorax sp. H27-G14]|uniref:ester cyclase n=1 Tax=Variovorax sp. H27-G14 TaxID=3111914 RepID=UPI0038FC467D